MERKKNKKRQIHHLLRRHRLQLPRREVYSGSGFFTTGSYTEKFSTGSSSCELSSSQISPAVAPTTLSESSASSPPVAAPTTAEVPAPAPSKSKKSKKHNAPPLHLIYLDLQLHLPELPDLASTLPPDLSVAAYKENITQLDK